MFDRRLSPISGGSTENVLRIYLHKQLGVTLSLRHIDLFSQAA
jgi:hypothetical protein